MTQGTPYVGQDRSADNLAGPRIKRPAEPREESTGIDLGLPKKGAKIVAYGSRDQQATAKRLTGYLREEEIADKRWRKRALTGIKFFYGEQWDERDKQVVEDRGQAALVINESKAAARVVLGLMLGRPFDWDAKPAGMDDDQLSDFATSALKYVANRNLAMDTYKRVYTWMLGYGMSAVLTGSYVRKADLREEEVQFRWLDSREVGWDRRCRENDMAGARYVRWTRRMLLSDARATFEIKKDGELESQAGNTSPVLDDPSPNITRGLVGITPPQSMWDRLHDWNEEGDRKDPDHDPEVVIHEFWEARPQKCWIAESTDGTKKRIQDPGTPEGQAALMQAYMAGSLERFFQDDLPVITRRVLCGPFVLEEEETELESYPIVFAFYERDHFGDPVSLMESMKDPQRDLNWRSSRALYDMSGQQMRVSQQMLTKMGLTLESARALAADPSALWMGDEGDVGAVNRMNQAPEHLAVMDRRSQQIKSASGANADLQGGPSRSDSGVSKQMSADQGQTMQRDSESSLMLFHRILGQQLFWNIQRVHNHAWAFRVQGDDGKHRLVQMPPNTLAGNAFDITIDEMPWTPTMRERTAGVYRDMLQGEEDPMIRAALRRAIVMVAEIPQKHKVLEIMDKAEEQRSQTPPPPPPQKTVRDIVSINYADLDPVARAAVLQQLGIPSGPPQAPEPVQADPTKLALQEADHRHALTQKALDHEHEIQMAQMRQQQGMQSAEHGAMLTQQQAQQAEGQENMEGVF